MIVLTDNPEYSSTYFNTEINSVNNYGSPLYPVIEHELLQNKDIFSYNFDNNFWKFAVVTEHSENSQFDMLLNLANNKYKLPDKILCLAGHGIKFHGFRNRHWVSIKGNIHLSCYFKPNTDAVNTGLGFTILSAVSVTDTLDSIAGLHNKAQIKWVNDIIINESKICGVIAQTQIRGNKVTDAVIGIGLNVEAAPEIEPSSYVPKSTSVNLHSTLPQNIGDVTKILLEKIRLNYEILLSKGYKPLLEKYRHRSSIIGRNITVWSDPINSEPELTHKGKVYAIGEYLELYLEGQNEPVTGGRVVPE